MTRPTAIVTRKLISSSILRGSLPPSAINLTDRPFSPESFDSCRGRCLTRHKRNPAQDSRNKGSASHREDRPRRRTRPTRIALVRWSEGKRMSVPVTHRGIIVGVDGSSVSKLAVDWAARDAAMRNIALTMVNVQDPPMLLTNPTPFTFGGGMSMAPGYREWQQDAGREILNDAFKTVRDATKGSPIEVTSEMVNGPAVRTLVNLSKEAQLVVVGSRGRGALARVLLGSVSTGLVHHAHCPVAVIHDQYPLTAHPSEAPVVVGIDGSPASELATSIAFDEASWRGAELVAMHAWSDTEVFEFPGVDRSTIQALGEETLSERLAGWQERYPDVLVRRVVVADRPAQELVEQSKSAQLVVVGSHGRGGFTGMLLGSVSTAVAQSAQVPMIVARRP